MGGFEFGAISHLDPTKTLICFVIVICFVVTFDVAIGVLEYYLEGSPIYNRMVQMIYKELMLMGVVSFIIIMVQAGRKAEDYVAAEKGVDWIAGIDYSHIVLFFLTVFFVVHAFYLMRKSIVSNAKYRRKFTKELPEMIKELDAVQANPQSGFFYNLQYLPFSHLRDQVEFYLTLSLFRDTYWLPTEFNYADYLSGCFSRYALKTIDRSFYTWILIIVLVVLNFVRGMLGLGLDECAYPHTYADDHATDDHSQAARDHRRRLAATVHGPVEPSVACVEGLMKLFLMAAALLCLYTFFMMIVCRIYKIRLIYRIGFENPSDYHEFLQFSQQQDEKDKLARMIAKRMPNQAATPLRMSMEELKKEIERVLDEDEHGEEAEFKVIAEFLSYSFGALSNGIGLVLLKIRVLIKHVRALCSDSSVSAPVLHIMDAPMDSPVAENGGRKTMSGKLEKTPSTLANSQHPKEEAAKERQNSAQRKSLVMQKLTQRTSVIAPPSSRNINAVSTGQPLQNIAEEAEDGNEIRKAAPAPTTPTTMLNTPVAVRNAGPPPTSTNNSPTHYARATSEKESVLSMLDQLEFEEHGGFLSNVQDRHSNSNLSKHQRRRNSVAVHAPDNNFSNIEKFRKMKLLEKRKERGMNYTMSLGIEKPKNKKTSFGGLLGKNKIEADKHEAMESNPDDEFRLSSDFSDIFLFGKPELFYGAIEICMMLNCLYLAFWITDFIVLSAKLDVSDLWHTLNQLAMVVPAFVVIPMIGYIIETCSLLRAISELNLEVVHEVIHEAEDTRLLMQDLREKMLRRIKTFESLNQDKVQIIHALFDEIDQDGSGKIDKIEFRYLLRMLKMTYSNERFTRLFRAVDTSGDGQLGWDELYNLLFPGEGIEEKKDDEENHIKIGNEGESAIVEEIVRMNPAEIASLGGRIRSLSQVSEYSDTDSDDEQGQKKAKRRESSANIGRQRSSRRKIENSTGKQSDAVRQISSLDRKAPLHQQISNQLNSENMAVEDEVESVESND